MATKKFDLLVEKLLSEGRRPKEQKKVVIDFPKLEEYLQQMSDDNPFKGMYNTAVKSLKSIGNGEEFTNEEMAEEPKSPSEWLKQIELAYTGKGIDPAMKKKLAVRFYEFLTDKDRNFIVDYAEQAGAVSLDSTSDVEGKILTFIKVAEEGTKKEEIYEYAARYDKSEDEVDTILAGLVESGQISLENGVYSGDSEESDVEPEDSELESDDDGTVVDDDVFSAFGVDDDEEEFDATDMYSKLKDEEESHGFK